MCHFFQCDNDITIVRMRKRKKKRKRKIMISTIPMGVVTIACARMNILFLFLLFNKTKRNDIVFNSYLMILILYSILDGIYQLNDQFMTKNILQDNMTYNEQIRNIFSKITIRCHDVLIVFIFIITTNVLEIMECVIFLNNNTMSSYNHKCKDDYFILFLLIDKIDKNNFILSIYLMILTLNTILDGIFALNNHFNPNILQDNLNKKNILEKIMICFVLTSLLHGVIIFYCLYNKYLCMNTLFSWCKWIKYKYNVNKESG